jgi:geranylgeranyl pyrophosphate synthase
MVIECKMVPSQKNLMAQVKAILKERGQKAIELAKVTMIQEPIEFEPLREAMRYFMEEVWYDASHPTLLSLACEAVGGNPDSTTRVGAAVVLLAGGADVHDDIIDQSISKDSTETVFGKFGEDTAVLIGDALLFRGLLMLHEACESLQKEQKQEILRLAKDAFFKIGNAEAQEASLRGKLELSPDEYLNIIKMKISVAEASARMGAVLGKGTKEEIESLGHYGKTLGLLMTLRDEFIDVFEVDELTNRFKNECLPLPLLYAFQDPCIKKEIVQLLEREITKVEMDRILDLVINSPEVRKLGKKMHLLVKETIQNLQVERKRGILVLLLESTLQDLPY